MLKVIDLFAGCGGFSLGFKKAEFNIIKAVEFDKQIANSYINNHKNVLMINEDIKNIDNKNYFKINEADIIIGGPPCQGFSMAGARIRNGFINDDRNYLFKHYFNIVKLVQPKIFLMENVKGILSLNKGEIFNEIKNLFSDKDNFNGNKYNIYQTILNAKDYGIPQNRERVIIIGVLNNKIDLEIIFDRAKKQILKQYSYYFDFVSIEDAIKNLPNPTEDGLCYNIKYESNYEKFLKSPSNSTFNHITTKHSKKSLERIKKINIDENFKSLDEKINSIHSGSYGRLNYNGISNTITTRFDTPSGGKFIHPEYNRTITPSEAARIQSFPDDFQFLGSKSSICKQIGNAVPFKISYFCASIVKEIINEYFNE